MPTFYTKYTSKGNIWVGESQSDLVYWGFTEPNFEPHPIVEQTNRWLNQLTKYVRLDHFYPSRGKNKNMSSPKTNSHSP